MAPIWKPFFPHPLQVQLLPFIKRETHLTCLSKSWWASPAELTPAKGRGGYTLAEPMVHNFWEAGVKDSSRDRVVWIWTGGHFPPIECLIALPRKQESL